MSRQRRRNMAGRCLLFYLTERTDSMAEMARNDVEIMLDLHSSRWEKCTGAYKCEYEYTKR